jgi:chemotaxis protein methyltransferase CheR
MSFTSGDFEHLSALLRARTGFVLEPDKVYLLETRLAELLSRNQLRDGSELVARLREGAESSLEQHVIEAMLNNETSFFRDIGFFHALEATVLPRLLAARAEERTLDVLCCACSTGQEPYSLAMLLAKRFPPLDDWRIRIVATDFNARNLERARRGRYNQFEVNRGLPASMLVRYFEQDAEGWVVRSELRERVEFQRSNLLEDAWPLDEVDLLLLRNVMIYWDPDTKRAVLDRAARALRPHGCLALGGAETTYYLHDGFDRYASDTPCCFRLV